MSDLKDFNDGFHDGWAGRPRQKNRGGLYIRSYKKGREAQVRDANGGDELGAVSPRRRRVAVSV